MPKMPVQAQPRSPIGFGATAPKSLPQPKLNEVQRKQLLIVLQQGMILQREGKFIDAERCYQMVLQRAPLMPEANNLMGTIAMEAEDFSVAVDFFEKAVAGLPRDPLIRHNIASALVSLGEYHAATTHLRKALDVKPGQFESQTLMASAYNRLSRSADALPFAEKALRMRSGHADARMAYTEALINLGRMDDAATYLNDTIAAKIAVPACYKNLSVTRKFSADAPELAAIRREIENASYSGDELSMLHFAAAKMCVDARLYDEAMAHFLKAKAFSAASYDVVAFENRVDKLIALFNPIFFAARQSFGDPSSKPVFIVGMPRSGTTLTEQIISSHGQVVGAGELSEIASISRGLGDNPKLIEKFTARLSTMSGQDTQIFAQRYLKFIARTSHEALRITDKMPHNFEHVGLIALLFPNATLIHCKRDAIDNCLSCYMNSFSEAHAYNTDLTKLGRYYRAYDRLMKHWHKVMPDRIFENQYETLVDDQEGQTRKLIDHCKLEWDEACLNYTENERSVTTISRWQVRQPIYKTSMKRWKHYAKHLGPLIAALGDLAETE